MEIIYMIGTIYGAVMGVLVCVIIPIGWLVSAFYHKGYQDGRGGR